MGMFWNINQTSNLHWDTCPHSLTSHPDTQASSPTPVHAIHIPMQGCSHSQMHTQGHRPWFLARASAPAVKSSFAQILSLPLSLHLPPTRSLRTHPSLYCPIFEVSLSG